MPPPPTSNATVSAGAAAVVVPVFDLICEQPEMCCCGSKVESCGRFATAALAREEALKILISGIHETWDGLKGKDLDPSTYIEEQLRADGTGSIEALEGSFDGHGNVISIRMVIRQTTSDVPEEEFDDDEEDEEW